VLNGRYARFSREQSYLIVVEIHFRENDFDFRVELLVHERIVDHVRYN